MVLHSVLLGRFSPLPITRRAFFFSEADLFCPVSNTGSYYWCGVRMKRWFGR